VIVVGKCRRRTAGANGRGRAQSAIAGIREIEDGAGGAEDLPDRVDELGRQLVERHAGLQTARALQPLGAGVASAREDHWRSVLGAHRLVLAGAGQPIDPAAAHERDDLFDGVFERPVIGDYVIGVNPGRLYVALVRRTNRARVLIQHLLDATAAIGQLPPNPANEPEIGRCVEVYLHVRSERRESTGK
jgi:hypothetical protein